MNTESMKKMILIVSICNVFLLAGCLGPTGFKKVRTLVLSPDDYTQVSAAVESLKFGPGGRYLGATAASYVILWNVDTGNRWTALEDPAGGEFADFAFSPGAEMLAAITRDGTVVVWDLATRHELARLSVGQLNEDETKCCEAAIDWSTTSRLAAGTEDGALAMWKAGSTDVASWVRLQSWSAPGSDDRPAYIEDIEFSPDGGVLAISGGGLVQLWDVSTQQQLDYPVSPWGFRFGFDSTGDKIVSAVGGPWAVVLDLQSGQSVELYDKLEVRQHTGTVSAVAWSHAQDAWVATGGDDGFVLVWDISKPDNSLRALPAFVDMQGTISGTVTSVAFGPGGNVLAAGSSSGQIVVWSR